MNTSISINPANGKILQEFPRMETSLIDGKIHKIRESFHEWKSKTFYERTVLMKKAASLLESGKENYAKLITLEMGKTYKSAIKEVEKCAWIMNYFADHAEEFLKDEIIKTDAIKSFVTFNPLGIILAVMPWNFPFYQVIRFAAPALMAGNVCILKHSSNVQGCAIAIEEIFIQAGFPENTFNNFNVEGSTVESIIRNKNISAVTLTGSTPAGIQVATAAASLLKRSVLELGGSDAYIILEDVNIDKAVEIATTARLQNNGETCIAGKRFIVIEKIQEKFLEKFKKSMESRIMGDPMLEDTDYGPLARKDLREQLHEQVLKSIKHGAELLTGGFIPEGEGYYYPATILTDVKPGMPAFDEELFGPVAAVIYARDETEAIELANHSNYGLGSAVITSDLSKGEKIASEKLEAGNAFVNHIVVSDPRLPFGGIKESGYGRELSHYGIKEFVNIKSVWVSDL
jgi:succinate-semialdehyde dehydrogenase/glutarate-semialdehyde dehydrogenase